MYIAKFYGFKEDTEYDIDFDIETVSVTEPNVKYEYDDSLQFGVTKIKQGGSNATTVNVYKVVKLNGNVISRDLVVQDTYKSLDKIIVKGNSD